MLGCVSAAMALASRPEALEAVGIGGQRRRQDLEGDVPIEARIQRPVHLTHTASAKLLDDLVGTKGGADHFASDSLERASQ